MTARLRLSPTLCSILLEPFVQSFFNPYRILGTKIHETQSAFQMMQSVCSLCFQSDSLFSTVCNLFFNLQARFRSSAPFRNDVFDLLHSLSLLHRNSTRLRGLHESLLLLRRIMEQPAPNQHRAPRTGSRHPSAGDEQRPKHGIREKRSIVSIPWKREKNEDVATLRNFST